MSVVLIVAVLLVGLGKAALDLRRGLAGDPTFWERSIRGYERADRRARPAVGGVVMTGSSSIRRWAWAAEDLGPSVINRGFGGSQIHCVTHYLHRLVVTYEPSTVVLYSGDNDLVGTLGPKKTAAKVVDDFRVLIEAVHDALPGVPVVLLSIKPSPRRMAAWPAAKEANEGLEALAAADPGVTWVDVASVLMDGDAVRDGLFTWDGIHMNREGYRLWGQVLRPVLEALA